MASAPAVALDAAIADELARAAGTLDHLLGEVDDSPCEAVIEALATAQQLLAHVSTLVLRRHVEECASAAIRQGRADTLVNELMEAVRFDRTAFLRAATTVEDG